MSRVAAAVLTALVASAQIALFAVAERQVQASLSASGPGPEAGWLRWVLAAGWATPWVAAAVLFAVGGVRRGAAVAITSATLAVTTGLASLGRLPEALDLASSDPWRLWVAELGGGVVWLLALVAGIASWYARPRGDWRVGAPGPVGWYVTLAVLAWLPAAFRATQFAPAGAPRAFVETLASDTTGIDLWSSVAGSVVVGVLLVVAPRLRPDVGGVLLLAYAVPTFLADLGGVLRVATEDDVIFTPAGALGSIGVLGLLGVGSLWATRRVPAG